MALLEEKLTKTIKIALSEKLLELKDGIEKKDLKIAIK